jgi:hypothetical protein
MSNTDTTLPREFNVGALADKLSEASLALRTAPPFMRPVLAARLAGLQEAWLLLTRGPEVTAAMGRAYRGGDQTFAKEQVILMEDETVLITGLVAGGESWIATVPS